jgi:hypothetical protein
MLGSSTVFHEGEMVVTDVDIGTIHNSLLRKLQ